MESPEDDEQPEAPAARLGGWGRAAPLFEWRVGETCFSSFRLLRLRLSESCADIPVRLPAPSRKK